MWSEALITECIRNWGVPVRKSQATEAFLITHGGRSSPNFCFCFSNYEEKKTKHEAIFLLIQGVRGDTELLFCIYLLNPPSNSPNHSETVCAILSESLQKKKKKKRKKKRKKSFWNVLLRFWLRPVLHISSIMLWMFEQRKNGLSLLLLLVFG